MAADLATRTVCWSGRLVHQFSSFKTSSDVDRYKMEVKRILGVLETGLSTNGTGYLVENESTAADLVFAPSNQVAHDTVSRMQSINSYRQEPC